MWTSLLALLFGAITAVSAGAVLPVRQATQTNMSSIVCHAATTVFATTTITQPPSIITVVAPNNSSIASSLSYAAAIDSEEVLASSEIRPISAPPDTSTPTFVHPIVAPGYEASETTGAGFSVYFVSVGPSTTDWSYTPSQDITVGFTTVTVLPYSDTPLQKPNTTITSSRIPTTTVSPHSFSVPTTGWNSTKQNNTLISPVATGSGGLPVIVVTTLTATTFIATTTIDVILNTTAPPPLTTCSYETAGYGSVSGNLSHANDHTMGKRQVCTLISAFINGRWASWCNNWDGSTTLSITEWTTTTIASSIPGASIPPGASVSQSSSTSSASVKSTIPPVTVTVTASVLPATSTSSASPTPTSCGQVGAFEISFDDLPAFSPSNNDTADFPPIFNPFEHFWWSDGWAYGPPPTEPFAPHDGSHLAEFIPSAANNDTASPDAGLLGAGCFGAGTRNYNNDYWFNAESAWIGCDNGATDPSVSCDFVATGYQWSQDAQAEHVVVTQHFPQPPCPNFQNCQLREIFFTSEFTALTSLCFYANVQGQLKILYVDDLELSWWDNSCAAGLARISGRK